jgi:hypothetical protein
VKSAFLNEFSLYGRLSERIFRIKIGAVGSLKWVTERIYRISKSIKSRTKNYVFDFFNKKLSKAFVNLHSMNGKYSSLDFNAKGL